MDIKGSVVFCQNDFISSSFSSFRDMRQKSELIDFRVAYEGRSIVGHRLILAASVPYFHKLFSRSEDDAFLEEISPDSLESIVNFAYNGTIEITSQNVQNLLVASKFLEILQIYDACWKFLEEGIHLNNVWKIRDMAGRHDQSSTIDIADCYIRKNFEAFSKLEAFRSLPFSYLRTLIQSDDINVSSEESVCEAVVRWAKSSPGHQKFLFKLLQNVRLSQLSFRYLTKLAVSEEIIQTCVHSKEVIKEATLLHSSFGTTPKFSCLTAGPRTGMKFLKARDTHNMHGVFALCLSKSELSVKSLDLQNSTWKSLSSYKSCQVHTIAAFEGVIYVFLDKAVVTLDVKTLNWCQLPTEYKSLSASKSVLHNSKIYLFGVYRNIKGTVQCFDPLMKTFLKKEKMKTPIRDPGVASWDRYIYITGGTFEGKVCDTTQRYCPDTGEWTQLSPMLHERWEHGCSTLNGMIYVCGGYCNELLSTAEIYNPQTDRWRYIQSMNSPRWELILVPCNGRLYTYPRRPRYLNVSPGLEIYDPDLNEWKIGTQLPDAEYPEIFLVGLEAFGECSAQGESRTEAKCWTSSHDVGKNIDDYWLNLATKSFNDEDSLRCTFTSFDDLSLFAAQCDDSVSGSDLKKRRQRKKKPKRKTDDNIGE